MAKVVMVVGAFVCAVIGGLIAQAVAGSKGFAVGAAVGFLVGFCATGFVYGRLERKPEDETATGPTQDEG